jgi:regulator of protease activity HflC (stomatin/prohibitin superfamily)
MGSILFLVFLSIIAFTGVCFLTALLKKRPIVAMGQERIPRKPNFYLAGIAAVVVFLVGLALASFTQVRASNVGIVTQFGEVMTDTLSEGPHFVRPWEVVTSVFVGLDVTKAEGAQAASKDLQTVHTDLVANFRVDPLKAKALFEKDPALNYVGNYVNPAIFEVFKAVVARYTAEELVTKRNEVSEAIVTALRTKLGQYGLIVQDINITNFKFSKAFDDAIEAKVTASQNAEKASRDLQRIQFEAEQKVAQAKGEAESIRIQSEAIQQNGGEAYLRMKTIERWNGALPQYVGAGNPMSMFSLNK